MASSDTNVPIDFKDYKLNISDAKGHILTAKPKTRGPPAVTVNLNEVVGVHKGKLEFGRKMFSKDVVPGSARIEFKKDANYLVAQIKDKDGTIIDFNSPGLRLDGNLQISIPADTRKRQDNDLCSACVIC
jgi:hypothetical protein